jgi:excisionase family DNA binding protein
MAVPSPERLLVRADDPDHQPITDVERFLRDAQEQRTKLLGPDGSEVPLPPPLFRVLSEAAHLLSRDEDIALVPVHRLLTTSQAADLLNVSRQYLVRLLRRGDIPYQMVGSHRRVRYSDLVAYKRARDAARGGPR